MYEPILSRMKVCMKEKGRKKMATLVLTDEQALESVIECLLEHVSIDMQGECTEETLFYPYSDCEDRTVLFAWLVKRLLGLEMVGLNYPGHVATAVHLPKEVKGDHVVYKGKKYAVTDPTYINASVGISMPDYNNVKPRVIPIK